MRVLISGACGRMGRAVASCAGKIGIEIACGVDPCEGKTDFPLYADFSAVTEDVDCIIDFSRPEALGGLLSYAVAHNTPCVICSTGFSGAQLEQIDAASSALGLTFAEDYLLYLQEVYLFVFYCNNFLDSHLLLLRLALLLAKNHQT